MDLVGGTEVPLAERVMVGDVDVEGVEVGVTGAEVATGDTEAETVEDVDTEMEEVRETEEEVDRVALMLEGETLGEVDKVPT